MKVNIQKLEKAAVKLTVNIESSKVKESYDEVLEEKVKTTKIEGFREGKAPKKMVEEKLGVSNLYGDVINHLLNKYYIQALKETKIVPLSNPKVEIKEFDLEKDFEFTAEIAVRPEIKVKETYKEELKKYYKEKSKKQKKENEEKLKKGEKIESHVHLDTGELMDVLLKNSEVEIADVLIEDEANRMLSRLLHQAQSIGLSMEDYLKTQNKTAEKLREEYTKIAEDNLKAEFILSHLINSEKIETSDKEIDDMFLASGLPDYEEKSKDPTERFYVKSIIQKNKLITKLIEEIEGEHKHE